MAGERDEREGVLGGVDDPLLRSHGFRPGEAIVRSWSLAMRRATNELAGEDFGELWTGLVRSDSGPWLLGDDGVRHMVTALIAGALVGEVDLDAARTVWLGAQLVGRQTPPEQRVEAREGWDLDGRALLVALLIGRARVLADGQKGSGGSATS
jgi:hypothetical protein